MVLILILENSLRLIRPHELFRNKSCFQLMKTISQLFLKSFLQSHPNDLFSIVQYHEALKLSTFTSDLSVLLHALEELKEPSTTLVQPLSGLIEQILVEVVKYWGQAEPINVLVFTDGLTSVLEQRACVPDCRPLSLNHDWPEASFIFYSLKGNKLSRDLQQVFEHFQPRSVIFALDKHLQAGTQSLESRLDQCASEAASKCLHWCGLSRSCNVSLICGHLSEQVHLNPILSPTRCDPESAPDHFSVYLEIFGFLNATDLSNPPVASRHNVRQVATSNVSPLLPLLLASMQETKTVAMCNIFPVDRQSTCKPTRHPWRHGFVHPFDSKQPYLLLSVFPSDCTGLPWLGQFQHLAPVEDFAGVQLYDDREGISPFPVLAPDRLSYGALSDAGQSNRAGQAETFRYVSWASPSALLTDVNKVLRLGRRLPEKATLFFKELSRFRSAALAYGCPDLLEHVASLTEAAHAGELQPNSASASVIAAHLKTMRSMITAPHSM